MLQPPSLSRFPHYPVTSGVALASVLVTGLWWSGHAIEALLMNFEVWDGWQLWRAVTSILPHVNFFHLAFNLYWFWAFGTLVERIYGHFRFAGIILLFALTSSLLEFALFGGGVGLSGVGYGLWAMLWVLERRDVRFAGAVDSKTSQMFVGWFLLCVALTFFDIMPVANLAHAGGAAMGALLGLATSSRGVSRRQSVAGLVGLLILSLVGATLFWPWIAFSQYAQAELEYEGSQALEHNEDQRARRLLEISAHLRHAPARNWYNLGIAYQRLKQYEAALAAFEHAAQMPEATADMRQVAQEMKDYLARRKAYHPQP